MAAVCRLVGPSVHLQHCFSACKSDLGPLPMPKCLVSIFNHCPFQPARFLFTWNSDGIIECFWDLKSYFLDFKEAIPALEILLQNVEKKHQFLHVHYKMCVLLRVLSSDRVIDVARLDRNLNDIYQYIQQEFPWASISPSVHALLGHGSEFVRKNDNMGLCTLSEQGSEGKYAVLYSSRRTHPNLIS